MNAPKEDKIAEMMIQALFEEHGDDFDSAIIRIEEWRGFVNVMERLVNIAKDHPDGWDHVRKMFQEGSV